MKKLFLLPLATMLISFVVSCGSDRIPEGKVEYAITYPNLEISGFMKALLPETMTITFKGTKMKTTIERGSIFTTEIVSDEETRSVEMRLDFGDKLYYTILNKDDVDNLIASQPHYDLAPTSQKDSIAGMFAQEYTVDCATDTISHINAWFTDDLAPKEAYWFTSYASVKGFPLIYDAERYGIMMHLEVTQFSAQEIQESAFDRAPELSEIPFDQYESEVQELFDLMME